MKLFIWGIKLHYKFPSLIVHIFFIFFQNSFFHGFKVKEYITLFVDRGSIKKLFSIDFVNIYLFRPESARSYKIGAVGNIRWVGNAVFSEMALRIFLISFIKLRNCKGRKVTESDFWKKILIWRYSRKRLQISPKSDTLIFSWLVGW